jgi:uncharacterized Tic20 family protein
MNLSPTATTTEGRIWAVFAHLSALSFGVGILLPVVGWSVQRHKSNYASFQCLQALGYQSVGFTVWVLSYLVLIILSSIILLATLGSNSVVNPNVLQSPGMIPFFILVFGLPVLYLVLPIIAAIACSLGKDFRYPFMGDRLARFLEYQPAQDPGERTWLHEDHEFRWVAAMGHFSILIVLWGMLAPLTAWILQGKNSPLLKFQSIQTLVYQGIATILFLVGGFIYAFGLILFPIMLWSGFSSNLDSPTSIIGLIIFIVILLVAMFIILIVPLLHILGQWAGYRVLKGDDYRYPFVGRLVERWLARQTLPAGDGGLRSKGTP